MEKEIFAYVNLLSRTNGNAYGIVNLGEEVEIRFHGLFCFVALFCFVLRKTLTSSCPFVVWQTQVTGMCWVNVLFALENTLASQRLYSLTNEYQQLLGYYKYVSPSSQMTNK